MAAISFLSQQIANMRSQQVPDDVISAAEAAYKERLKKRTVPNMAYADFAPLKLKISKNGDQYPECVKLIQLIQSKGSEELRTDPNKGSFRKKDLGDPNKGHIQFPSYAAAVAQVQSDIWHFDGGSLLPYPDKSGTYSNKYASQFEDIRAYAQSYSPSLLNKLLNGTASNVNTKRENTEKALKETGEGAMGSSVDVIETAEKLLSMNTATLGPDEVKVINDRLGSLLDARYPDRVYEFIYLAVEYSGKYPNVMHWLRAGNDTGVGFTDEQLNQIKIEAENRALPPILEKDSRLQEYNAMIKKGYD